MVAHEVSEIWRALPQRSSREVEKGWTVARVCVDVVSRIAFRLGLAVIQEDFAVV